MVQLKPGWRTVSHLWQEKKEGSGCNPRTSLAEAKRCPKSAANEGTQVSLLAHTASLCKCSSFNFDLTFVVLTSFFPAFSSLSEIGLWETDVKFDALLSRPLLPMFFWLKYLIEQLHQRDSNSWGKLQQQRLATMNEVRRGGWRRWRQETSSGDRDSVGSLNRDWVTSGGWRRRQKETSGSRQWWRRWMLNLEGLNRVCRVWWVWDRESERERLRDCRSGYTIKLTKYCNFIITLICRYI